MSKELKQWLYEKLRKDCSLEIEVEVFSNAHIIGHITSLDDNSKKYFFFLQEKYFNIFIEELKGIIENVCN